MCKQYQTTLYYEDKEEYIQLVELLKNHFGSTKNSDAIYNAMRAVPQLIKQLSEAKSKAIKAQNQYTELKQLVAQRQTIDTEIKELVNLEN